MVVLSLVLRYIPTRRWRWASLAWFILLLLLNCFTVAKWIAWPSRLPVYVRPFESGAFALIAMAGVITSNLLLSGDLAELLRGKTLPAVLFAAILGAAGWRLTSLGISKVRVTPTWCLYGAASSILIFTALYWISDVRARTRWPGFVKPAGANTLTTYLLPDLYYVAFAGTFLTSSFLYRWPGVIRALVFTAVMLALVTEWRVRLQL